METILVKIYANICDSRFYVNMEEISARNIVIRNVFIILLETIKEYEP